MALALLVTVLVLALGWAEHLHQDHLDNNFIYHEALHLAKLGDPLIYRKIDNSKASVKILINRHDKFIGLDDKEDGYRRWKSEYESVFCHDFDRALMA
jgi:hypothetical protein